MTYEEVIARVARLTDDEVTADYRADCIKYIDSVQRELATTVRPIVKNYQVCVEGGFLPKPMELYQLIGLYDEYNQSVGVADLGETFKVGSDGVFRVCFKAYPIPVGEDMLEEEVQVSRDALSALISGTAMYMCIDDAARFSVMTQDWANQIGSLVEYRQKKVRVTFDKSNKSSGSKAADLPV